MSNQYIGDYDGPAPTGIDWQGGQGNWGLAQYGDDRRSIVVFHTQSVYNEYKSTLAGRRVYDEEDFVMIWHAGEREQKIDRKVQPSDKVRWPNQWRAYQNKQEQVVEGTPIDLLLPNHPSIADNFKSFGITTVEQLAHLSATGIQNVGMGAQDYVNYARSYLAQAKQGVGFHEVQKELSERDQKIRIQEQQIATLMAQVEQLTKQQGAILAATSAVAAGQVPAAPAAQPKTFAMPPIPARMSGQAPASAETSPAPRRRGRPPREENYGPNEA